MLPRTKEDWPDESGEERSREGEEEEDLVVEFL